MKSHKKKKMIGGVAPSCVTGPDVSRYLNSCHTANIHNSSPQASLDLNSKYMNYGSRASMCQSGGSNNKRSFNKYVSSLSKKLKLKDNIKGGGYSVDPGNYIAGMPIYKAYSDCCPPAIIGNKLLLGEGGGSICGQRGGGKANKSQRSNRSSRSSRSNRSNRSSRSNRSQNQKGGSYKSSKPGKFPSSFDTKRSHFSETTVDRTYDESQNDYSPLAI